MPALCAWANPRDAHTLMPPASAPRASPPIADTDSHGRMDHPNTRLSRMVNAPLAPAAQEARHCIFSYDRVDCRHAARCARARRPAGRRDPSQPRTDDARGARSRGAAIRRDRADSRRCNTTEGEARRARNALRHQARRLAAERARLFELEKPNSTRHAGAPGAPNEPEASNAAPGAPRWRLRRTATEGSQTNPKPRRCWSLVERGHKRTRAARGWPRPALRFARKATTWPPAGSRQHTSRSGSGNWQLIAA